MKPLKILYHHRTASKDGQAVHIEEMIHALQQLGHEIRVVAPGMGQSVQFGEKAGVLKWVQQRLPRFAYEALELLYNVPIYLRLRRAMREFKPDVLYERHHLYLLAGACLARRSGIPYVLEVNSPLFEERAKNGGLALKAIARSTERWVWRQADALLPVTQVLAEILINSAQVRRERIKVIPNGIDPERFAGYEPLAEAKKRLRLQDFLVLGFTGFVRDWNALDRVIRYLARKGNEHCMLLLVGDGPARAALEALAAAEGVADRVRIVGVVGRDEIRNYVAAFDVALQPAANPYASPLKLFEYLALGRAIVAPAQPNLLEVLHDGVDAVLFDPQAPDALEVALDRLVHQPELRAALGPQAAQLIASRDYTWMGNAKRVAQLSQVLAAQSARPRSLTASASTEQQGK